uniref:Cell division protein ZipA n=1 Tax=Panagrellus redivivus TaxID=6233 RepID=A0A7E4UN92_PANRE
MLFPILIALIAVALGYLAHKKFIANRGDAGGDAAAAAPAGKSLKVDNTQRESLRTVKSNYATAESTRSTNEVPEREASSRDVKTARFATDEEYEEAKRGDTIEAEPTAPPVVQTRSELLRAQLADLPDSTAKNQSPIVRSNREVKPDPATASAIAKTTSKKETKKEAKKGKKKTSSKSK